MSSKPISVTCPTCGKIIPWTDEEKWKPFCSERCKLIDLGEWAEGGHRIPGKPCPPGDHDDEIQ